LPTQMSNCSLHYRQQFFCRRGRLVFYTQSVDQLSLIPPSQKRLTELKASFFEVYGRYCRHNKLFSFDLVLGFDVNQSAG
jgi:hypothetical protein